MISRAPPPSLFFIGVPPGLCTHHLFPHSTRDLKSFNNIVKENVVLTFTFSNNFLIIIHNYYPTELSTRWAGGNGIDTKMEN